MNNIYINFNFFSASNNLLITTKKNFYKSQAKNLLSSYTVFNTF